MHTLALNAAPPRLTYRYGRNAHRRTLEAEQTPSRCPTTPPRPLMRPSERLLLAVERCLFFDRHPSLRALSSGSR